MNDQANHATMPSPIRVFCSYAHRDEKYRRRLEVGLKPLRRPGAIIDWYDRMIAAGDELDRTIGTHLEQADLILLLISPDFMASDYSHEREMKRAVERHAASEAHVIPIIVRHTPGWQTAPFGKLKALPTDGKPISGGRWKTQDEAWAIVISGITSVIASLRPHNGPTAKISDIPLGQQIQARMEQTRRELVAEQARKPRQRIVTLSEMLQAERDGTTIDLTPAPTFQEQVEERRRQALAMRGAEQATRKAVDDALQAHADKLMAPVVLKIAIDQTIDAAELERSIQGVAEGRFLWWSLIENTSVTDGDTGRAYRRITLHYDMGAGVERADVRIFVADGSGPYEPVITWRRFA